MQNILVATDYSETADDAIEYAAELSKRLGTSLIIFHAYNFPPVLHGMGIYHDFWFYSKQNENDIRELGDIIRKKYKIPVESIARQGSVVEEINGLIDEKKIDLVVMGLNSDKLNSNLLGTTSSVMFEKIICPILAIPCKTKFKAFKKVVLATDYKDEEAFDFKILEEIVNLYNADFSVLNVNNLVNLITNEEAAAGLHLGNFLPSHHLTFQSLENDDIVNGIVNYVNEKKPDVVVMLSKKHELIEKFTKPSFTRKLINETSVPLLALP